jgi:hypothetical protein
MPPSSTRNTKPESLESIFQKLPQKMAQFAKVQTNLKRQHKFISRNFIKKMELIVRRLPHNLSLIYPPW